MNRVCIVVPTYPQHYNYAVNFKRSFEKYGFDKQADLCFVFTNQTERDGFLPCHSIVLPKKLRVMQNRGIINIKKFYALMQLKNKYEYIIISDDEAEFASKTDLYAICERFFEEKLLFGNIVQNPPWNFMELVADHCKSFFGKEGETAGCPLYLWWNNLAVYDCGTLSEFFRITGIDKTISRLTFSDFDYYIYMWYLIIYKKFQVIDIGIVSECAFTEIVGPSEISTSADIDLDTKKRIYMATHYVAGKFELKQVFLYAHIDREIRYNREKTGIPIYLY